MWTFLQIRLLANSSRNCGKVGKVLKIVPSCRWCAEYLSPHCNRNSCNNGAVFSCHQQVRNYTDKTKDESAVFLLENISDHVTDANGAKYSGAQHDSESLPQETSTTTKKKVNKIRKKMTLPELSSLSNETRSPGETTTNADDVSHMTPGQSSIKYQPKKLTKMPQDKFKTRVKTERKREFLAKTVPQYQHIKSYIEACIYAGKVDRAFHCFNINRQRGRLLDLTIYNVLLRGFSEIGRIDTVRRLFSYMSQDGVTPNFQSYAHVLVCMGRSDFVDLPPLRRLLAQMGKEGFDVADIFNRCQVYGADRECIMKSVLAVEPDFIPNSVPIKSPCDLSLVDGLYGIEKRMADESFSASTMSDILTVEDLNERFDRQLRMERKDTVIVKSIDDVDDTCEKTLHRRHIWSSLKTTWHNQLCQAIDDKRRDLIGLKTYEHNNDYPFLCLLDTAEYAEIMIQAIMKIALSNFGEPITLLAVDIGNRVFRKFLIKDKIMNSVDEKVSSIYRDYINYFFDGDLQRRYMHREYWLHLEKSFDWGPTLSAEEKEWPNMTLVRMGSLLLNIIVTEVRVDNALLKNSTLSNQQLIPALYHMYNYQSQKIIGVIKPHPLLVQLLKEVNEGEFIFDISLLPTVVPPVPWCGVTYGGNLLAQTKLMRYENNRQRLLLEMKLETSVLDPVLDSLNILGSMPWIVNKPVLDVIKFIFTTHGDKSLDIPPPMDVLPQLPKYPIDNLTDEERRKVNVERQLMRRRRADAFSLRMDMLYKLSIADMYRDDIFWFPHNMDFRGRTYPVPPHFNHLGSDVTRGMLQFAQGKPLGDTGLDWLKIHLINLTGLQKRESLKSRLKYANTIMADVLDSADNPVTGRKWWKQSDEPWQTLACCMEIAKAERSADSKSFISHFPIHQDGSCNGLQHYAALGRDIEGAKQVNLWPFDTPQDVYTGVATKVEEQRLVDEAKGSAVARTLKGHVKRKVVKQTVMTVVYGVTVYGGRLQIQRQLEDLPSFPQNHLHAASNYLVHAVFTALKQMFGKTREIQDWFTECARLMSKYGYPVMWETPLGLPVVQPYHKRKTTGLRSRMTTSGNDRPHIVLTDESDANEKPDSLKQKNAFPPNYIHSLDSTHMMLTCLYTHRTGAAYVSVHDCFWTHACSVNVMNKICREQFVALHTQPLLNDLSDFMVDRFEDAPPLLFTKGKQQVSKEQLMDCIKGSPSVGEFDLKKVLDSSYFFS